MRKKKKKTKKEKDLHKVDMAPVLRAFTISEWQAEESSKP
jgi:hypothetical protein